MIYFLQPTIAQGLQRRSLLCKEINAFHGHAMTAINGRVRQDACRWQVTLGENLLFDEGGLQALYDRISNYTGSAGRLEFKLQLSNEAIRDYYSHSAFLDADGQVTLPLFAGRHGTLAARKETLILTLRELTTPITYPRSLAPPDRNATPLGLLLPFGCDHDLLFANQIAVFSNLDRRVRRSIKAIVRGIFSRRGAGLQQRVVRAWRQVHKTADIHPTAVIEGSIIGSGCRIGAHCVVRYSVLGEDVQLHDGAKVEYSVVGDRSWLMHDLVLYRSLVESDVFLIHGPYQFSCFQHRSGAFASIMMDYRPDAKPIKINTQDGIVQYRGRFLGALLKEGSSLLGGTLTSPGITIPAGKQISPPIASVTRAKDMLD